MSSRNRGNSRVKAKPAMIQVEARTVADLFLVEAENARTRAQLIAAMARAIASAHMPYIVATIDSALARAEQDKPQSRSTRRSKRR